MIPVRALRFQRAPPAWGVWLLVVLLAASTAGCLFPPVAAPVDATDLRQTPGTAAPPFTVFEQRPYQNTTTGVIEAGFSQMEVDHGSQPHVFDLPARLDAIRVTLDWEHDVYDLDLTARLLESPEDTDDPSWEDENVTGTTGDPDSPALLEVTDRSQIHFESPTLLRVTVSAETGLDVGYTLTVQATYLVPADTLAE